MVSTRGFEGVTAADLAKYILPKPSKYHARKTTIDGITFDSAKEARRYSELRALEKAGAIRGLTLQPEFSLYVFCDLTLDPDRDPLKLGIYRGDFRYDERQPDGSGEAWTPVVEDVKGFKTALYKWKKRHVESQYGIQIREV